MGCISLQIPLAWVGQASSSALVGGSVPGQTPILEMVEDCPPCEVNNKGLYGIICVFLYMRESSPMSLSLLSFSPLQITN